MRRALAGCAVAAAIGAAWTVTEAPLAEVAAPPTPAEVLEPAQVAPPEAAPDTTTTTAPVEVEPIACPSLGHPAHHQPCPPDEPISPQSRTVRPGGGGGACGGSLPPCWVLARESGGDTQAVNATGCGGRGCYGKWQADPLTSRALGYPGLMSDYSEPVQDEFARRLWDNGRGCSHWAAC